MQHHQKIPRQHNSHLFCNGACVLKELEYKFYITLSKLEVLILNVGHRNI